MLRSHITFPGPLPCSGSLGPAVTLPRVLQAWAEEPTHSILGLEEALLLPPRVPGSFHVLRAVGVRHDATDIWGRDGEGQCLRLGAAGTMVQQRHQASLAHIIGQTGIGRSGVCANPPKPSGGSKDRAGRGSTKESRS